jgi:pyrimidine-nucleoside phosphorylase
VPELLVRKRNGEELAREEVAALVDGFVEGSVADYQMSAFAMAVYFRGMSFDETVAMTLAMRDSGKVLDFTRISGAKVDKHSTGGVGDKVSICLAPMVAACGAIVPMMSGRGLGHTGGTLDKLEAIPGFRVDLSVSEFRRQLERIGCALIGQTGELAPADKRLYALRDVTGTVESIPLITSSILSKKLAEGIDALVLDVKVGRGAFMKSEAEARDLAKSLVRVGTLAGKKVIALLTDMNAPLGRTIGNGLETAEAIEVLHGRGADDLCEVTWSLGAEMLLAGSIVRTRAQGERRLTKAVADGSAAQKLKEIVEAQGGDPRVVDEPDRLTPARHSTKLASPVGGFVRELDPLELGLVSMGLGAGRTRADQDVDPGAGLVLHVAVGDRIERGQPLATLYAPKRAWLEPAVARAAGAIGIGKSRKASIPRLLGRIQR